MSFTDDFGSDEQRTSAATGTVTGAVMAACAVPSLSGRNVIWTGAMTVAVDSGNAGVFGFASGRFGSLDDQTFTVGANDYTTGLVSLRGNALTFATTNSDLTAEEQAVLRLHVCAADLDFSAARGPIGDHAYLFSTPGLSWSSGDTITLRLSLPATTTALGQVLGVGVAPGGNAQLVVTWTAVDTATGYTVRGPGLREALAGALGDQVALDLGEQREERGHDLGLDVTLALDADVLLERHEGDARLGEGVEDGDLPQRPTEPGEFADDQAVAVLERTASLLARARAWLRDEHVLAPADSVLHGAASPHPDASPVGTHHERGKLPVAGARGRACQSV